METKQIEVTGGIAEGKTGKQLIEDERQRQITKEGWNIEHDNHHYTGELTKSADCYYYYAEDNDYTDEVLPDAWPWDAQWWKPKNQLYDYIRAGALYKAELERCDRFGMTGRTYTSAIIGLKQCQIKIDNLLNTHPHE